MIPAASGYPQYSGNLIEPRITDRFCDVLSCRLNVLDFTTGDHLGALAECGDSITVRTKPISKARPLEKNQKMEDNYIQAGKKHLQVGKAMYDSMKIDKMDEKMICNSDQLIDFYLEDVANQFMKGIELDVLSTMVCGVDVLNQGCCAGKDSRCYNLGGLGKPLCFGMDSGIKVLKWLNDIYSSLMEACVVSPGHGYEISGMGGGSEPFIIIPIQLYNLMKCVLTSEYCCLSSETTPLVNGRLPERINNFHIFVSSMVPYYMENGQRTYMIPAGRRDATSFVMMMEETRKVEDSCYWGHKYQSMVAWGAAVTEPCALTLSRVQIKKED